MICKQILFLLLISYVNSSAIHVIFTVKNLATNGRLQLNLLTLITSLFEHTSKDNLHLHVIGDSDSHQFVDKVLENINYNNQVIEFRERKTNLKTNLFFSIQRLINLILIL